MASHSTVQSALHTPLNLSPIKKCSTAEWLIAKQLAPKSFIEALRGQCSIIAHLRMSGSKTL
jgi:hypothetical protein